MARHAPTWALSLLSAPYGLLGGVVFVTVPILLAGLHVSVAQQSTVLAVAASPTIWGLLLSPILDLRFSKRTYTVTLGLLSPALFFSAMLFLQHLGVLTVLLTLAMLTGFLYESAIAGWIAQISARDDYASVSGWYTIVYLGTAGTFGGLGVWLVRVLPLRAAAAVMAISMILPLLATVALPSASELSIVASRNCRTFFSTLLLGFRRKEFRLGLLVFVVPVCSFSFLFASVGDQFHASEHWVTVINGPLTSLMCAAGCLFGISVLRHISAVAAYATPGFIAALLTLSMIPAGKHLLLYSTGALLYSFLSGVTLTAFRVVLFETVGHNNPVGGTEASVLTAAANLPQRFLTAVNGFAFAHFGLNGMLADDSIWAIVSVVLLLIVLHPRIPLWRASRSSEAALDPEAGTLTS
jgi:PAT family beta-lactamase induction signal transducer AmpG